MPWQERWRQVSVIQSSNVILVESRADGSQAVLKWACARRDGPGFKNVQQGDRHLVRTEIVALGRLNEAGLSVPQVLDHNLAAFDTLDIPLYVVMEFIEGVTVKEYVKSDHLTQMQSDQIATVILTAFSLGITHGGIHPQNVMVRPDGTMVVIDWAAGAHCRGPLSGAGEMDFMAFWYCCAAIDRESLNDSESW